MKKLYFERFLIFIAVLFAGSFSAKSQCEVPVVPPPYGPSSTCPFFTSQYSLALDPDATVTYNWSVTPDGTISSASSPICGSCAKNITWNTQGQKTITVTPVKTCSTGEVISGNPVSYIVTVAPMPTAPINITGPAAVCVDVEQTFSIPAKAGYIANWTISPATGYTYSTPNDTDLKVTFTAARDFTIRVNYTNGGCSSVTIQKSVSAGPVAIITYPSQPEVDLCDGDSFLMQAATGTFPWYQWKKDGVEVQKLPHSSYMVREGGTYTLTTYNGTCTNTSAPIHVTIKPKQPIAITALDPTTVCENTGGVDLSATSGLVNYVWWKDGVALISGWNSTSYNAITTGTYRVTAWTESCQSVSQDIPITINPRPNATIVADGPTTFCVGGSVTLRPQVINQDWTYQWSDLFHPNLGTSTSLNVADAGTYYLKATNTLTGCSDSRLMNITTIGVVAEIVEGYAEIFYCEGRIAPLEAVSGYSYQWKKDGVPIPGATQYKYNATSSGDYSVVATITSPVVCSKESPTKRITYRTVDPTLTGPILSSVNHTVGDTYVTESGMSNYQWILPAGCTKESGGSPSQNFVTVKWTTAGPKSIYVNYYAFNGSCPSQYPTKIDVAVTTRPTAYVSSGNTPICAGGTAPVSGNVTAVGDWTLTLSDGQILTGSGNSAWNTNVSPASTTVYTIKSLVDANAASIAADLTGSRTVTVNNATPGTVAGNQSFCTSGDPAAFTETNPATGLGTITHEWFSSTDGINFSTKVGNGATYNHSTVLTQTTYFRRKTTFSTGSCVVYSNVLTVTVNPIPSVTTPDKTMCSDQQVMLPLTSTVPETTTYSWSVFTKSNPISGVTVGQTGTLNPIDNVLSNSSPNLIGTVTFRVTPTAAGCVGPYKDVIVSVNPKISAGTISGNQTICAGGNPTAFTHTVPSGLSSLDYQWQSSPNYSGTYQDLAGVKTAAYDIPAGEVTETTSYRRFVKGTQNGIECSTVTAPITVTVNKVTGNLITGDQIICVNGDPAEITEALTPTWLGSLTHSWKKSINGTSFSTISGATSKTYDPSSITQTTYYKRIATTVYNGTTCATESNVVTKTVEKPVVSATTPTQFCEATSVNATLVTAFNPNYLYRWFRNGSLLNGETSSTLNTTQTGSYHVEVTNQLTTCTNISSPDIVVSTPVGQIFADGDLCINGTVVLSTTSGHDDNHSWKVNGIIDHYYDDKPYFTVYDPATISVDYTPAGCPGSTVTASIDIYRNGSTCIYARVRSEEPQVETTQESSQIHGVYPNPASSKITVSIPKAVEHDLEVLLVSQIGYTILSGVIPKGEITTTLDSKNIAEGIYYVKVKSQVETMFTRKVVVRH